TQKGEQATAALEVYSWNAGLLEAAAQHRHEGEVLFWAHAYASRAAAEELLKKAADGYQAVLTRTDILQKARLVRDEAAVFLPPYVAYLEAAPATFKAWEAATEAAQQLDVLLASPGSGTETGARVSLVQEVAEVLEGHLQTLRRPFTSESVSELQKKTKQVRPHPAVQRGI